MYLDLSLIQLVATSADFHVLGNLDGESWRHLVTISTEFHFLGNLDGGFMWVQCFQVLKVPHQALWAGCA